jgi:hypothetical protein
MDHENCEGIEIDGSFCDWGMNISRSRGNRWRKYERKDQKIAESTEQLEQDPKHKSREIRQWRNEEIDPARFKVWFQGPGLRNGRKKI